MKHVGAQILRAICWCLIFIGACGWICWMLSGYADEVDEQPGDGLNGKE